MDTQLRRGVLDVCVLRSLCEGESYGYRIIKDISPYVHLSESTLYPILKRLEAAGCLEAHTAEHAGRLRRYYTITEKGRDRIKEFLTEWEDIMRAYSYIKEAEI